MFVLIVLFKDAHDALDGICIMVLVCLSVQIMERIWVSRYAIRKSEVDGDVHVDFTATEDVIQEWYSFLKFESIDGDAGASIKFHCLVVSAIDHLS